MPGEVIWPAPSGPVIKGEASAYLAVTAVDIVSQLSHVPQRPDIRRVRWANSDYCTFYDWQELERAVPLAVTELSVDDGCRLADQLESLHCALPYSEAERRWLRVNYAEPPTESGRWESIRRQEIAVVSNGLVQVMHGREMLRKWWAWRRETDEFAGQGSLDEACAALNTLASMFVIKE